jgi:hypothetical protein
LISSQVEALLGSFEVSDMEEQCDNARCPPLESKGLGHFDTLREVFFLFTLEYLVLVLYCT